MNEDIGLMMPVKVAPYDHQKRAFAFACDKFGVFDNFCRRRRKVLDSPCHGGRNQGGIRLGIQSTGHGKKRSSAKRSASQMPCRKKRASWR